jgi:hypothetical protein
MMYGNPFNHNFVCSCLHPLFPFFATPCHLALITETPYFCLADFFDSCLWGWGWRRDWWLAMVVTTSWGVGRTGRKGFVATATAVLWALVYRICYKHQLFFPPIPTGPFNRMLKNNNNF